MEVNMMRRGNVEMYAAVLDVLIKVKPATNPRFTRHAKITRIMYKANLNCAKAKEIVRQLQVGGLITIDGKNHIITDDGRKWLGTFQKMASMLNLDYDALINV